MLGGVGNTNGVLKAYDSAGNTICSLNNESFSLSGDGVRVDFDVSHYVGDSSGNSDDELWISG